VLLRAWLRRFATKLAQTTTNFVDHTISKAAEAASPVSKWLWIGIWWRSCSFAAHIAFATTDHISGHVVEATWTYPFEAIIICLSMNYISTILVEVCIMRKLAGIAFGAMAIL